MKTSWEYAESLWRPNSGGFSLSKYAPETILSTSFGVMLLNLHGRDEFLSRNGKKISEYLLGFLHNDGMLCDDSIVNDFGPAHTVAYLREQSTYFALIALDILGKRFAELPFIRKIADEEEQALNAFFETDFWGASNRMMFHLFFCAYVDRYGANDAEKAAARSIRELTRTKLRAERLNDGLFKSHTIDSLANSVFGSAHLYLYFDDAPELLPGMDTLNALLPLLHSSGTVLNRHGGACEDYNICEIALRAHRAGVVNQTLQNSLRKMARKIQNSRHRDGGFSYRLSSKFIPFSPFRHRSITYQFSSWKKMETPAFESDLWATLFRDYAVEAVRLMDGEPPILRSYALPAWGKL